jgi:hypothetical protein
MLGEPDRVVAELLGKAILFQMIVDGLDDRVLIGNLAQAENTPTHGIISIWLCDPQR